MDTVDVELTVTVVKVIYTYRRPYGQIHSVFAME